MEVALWGYYGTNYGDDIMMDVILSYFQEKGVKTKLIDIYGGNLEEKCQNKYKNLEVINYYKYTRLEKIQITKQLASLDLNIWGGGTIFTDADGDGNFNSFATIKAFGGKIGYIGVGIGALEKRSREFKTKYLLKRSEIVIFRDVNSLDRAIKYVNEKSFFEVSEDIAYSYFNSLKSIPNSKYNDYILLTWRNLVGYVSKDRELLLMDHVLEKAVGLVKEKEYSGVVLSALDENFDHESCSILEKKLKKLNVPVFYDKDSSISNINSLIKNSAFHISGRLHGSIASEFFGVPTLSLSYSPKINYFYKSLESDCFYDIFSTAPIEDKLIDRILNNNEKYDFSDKIKNSQKNFLLIERYSKDLIKNQKG